jgi:hypothetical protein
MLWIGAVGLALSGEEITAHNGYTRRRAEAGRRRPHSYYDSTEEAIRTKNRLGNEQISGACPIGFSAPQGYCCIGWVHGPTRCTDVVLA